ncbi:hypothetical protein D5F01_LYC03922 [Larimichthys crocea]|uniref:Anti-apoptotic protein NR13 n=1 Tax=Larimichthys crocea TaxID=215358 RepID=A0A6G0J1D6_LARCR|nr:hypothetical protein D5F01_LYC03922 [Larimichthys crocea]
MRGSPSAVRVCRAQSDIAGRNMSCGLWKETLALAEDYLFLCCTSPRAAPPPPSESAAAIRRLAQDMEAQHQARFNSLAQTFLKQCSSDLCTSLRKTTAGAEGHKAGAGPWAGAGAGQGLVHCRGLAETIADYLGEEKKDWLLENDGWEGLCKFSRSAREVSQDSSMKTALFAAAGVGLAGLTFLLVR